MFTFFPRLPPELRFQIWQDALPSLDFGRLYLYTRNCWRANWCDQRYMQTVDFCPDAAFQSIGMPLFFVNREARREALSWARKHGIDIRYQVGRFLHHGGLFHFQRRMSKDDILYINREGCRHFVSDVQALMEGSPRHRGTKSDITSIALPESFYGFQRLYPRHDSPLEYMDKIRTIYIVIGEQPDETGEWDIVPHPSRSKTTWTLLHGLERRNVRSMYNMSLSCLEGILYRKYEQDFEVRVEIVPAVAIRKWKN